ncbi:MAG: cystathionine gamma-synthase [Alphaproteobacteria bacterium]|nr:cystathionine gamma-synthase [Alphaproteobacteria bacterium]MDE2494666.1 cystathionine gamma-synthase [Alphaproteobacteria bacterium]
MDELKASETIAVTNGIAGDNALRAVTPPLYLSSTFAFEGFERPGRFDYSRTANPTRTLLADTLAKLEGGAGAVVVASGLAAINLALSCVESDQLIIAPHDCYAGTMRLLDARSEREDFVVEYVDQTDDKAVRRALRRGPALVLVETPSNPLMRIVDIANISRLAHEVDAKVAVDNTFLSPALQQPLGLGADYVIHSTTKYLNGHSDVIGGAVVTKEASDAEAFAHWANVTGVIGAPFDAYMTLRGLRTLFTRVHQQERTAGAIALFLQNQPQVAAVYYPGLLAHPGYDIAARQQKGFGAMLSFDLIGGREAVRHFVESLKIFTLAESLGGTESLIAHPKTMTHSYLSPDTMTDVGITDGLLRLSVGLEDQNDLIKDLNQALAALT